jgi:hypothetical protein
MYNRRLLLKACSALLAVAPFSAFAALKGTKVKIYKSPTCGCCSKWAQHLSAAGFEVDAENVADVNHYKLGYGVPVGLYSCHTAVVEGYVIEGHVPVSDIIMLLDEKPAIDGIAVPGMPMGSPGMESPNPEAYEVFTFKDKQVGAVFATHVPVNGVYDR